MQSSKTGNWDYQQYLKYCISKVTDNQYEIETEGTIGKEISLFARLPQAISYPSQHWAQEIAKYLMDYIAAHPITGYKFEFRVEVRRGSHTVIMKFYKLV